MMEKIIDVGGVSVKLKTNAGLLRRYRKQTGRDLIIDINAITQAAAEAEDDFSLPVDVLEKFEDISYCMAKYGDPTQPDDIDTWLEQFETFDIYQILPHIISLWNLDQQTTTEVKKNKE